MKTLAKTLLVALALCVCGGTTVHSQITITPDECRVLIHRLDTLNYLRAGHVLDSTAIANLELQLYQRDTVIYLQDSTISAFKRIRDDSDARAAKAVKSEYKWRGLALGACGTAVLAMLGMTLTLLTR